jgi:dTDP-3-amino-3,4,6-trideoxy-alpha-D-glucose transaminase
MIAPMVNLRPLLEATAPAWRTNLERLFERMHFVLGEQVAGFEREMAQAFGARFAVGVGTGTAAVELSVRAAGLGESGKEILTPALTSLFTAQAILAAGCRVRFADVDADTLLLDAEDAAARVGRRTAAILPVHLYGQPCDLAALKELGLPLVQDACQAHGARAGTRSFTRFGAAVAYSFYPTKNLPCLGDGGAVLTDSAAVAAKLRLLREGGRKNDQYSRLRGLNSRLDEMQACYLRAFLPHLAEWNADRARLASVYDAALAGCAGVHPVQQRPGSVYHLYVVRARRRERLRTWLAERGIMTAVHYPVPLHLNPAFAQCGLKRGDLPRAEKACREIVSLPLWPKMPEAMALEVAARVCEFYRSL